MVDRCRYCNAEVFPAEGMEGVWDCPKCNKGLNNTEVVVKHK
jgi:ribosomal protein L37AE/L43A